MASHIVMGDAHMHIRLTLSLFYVFAVEVIACVLAHFPPASHAAELNNGFLLESTTFEKESICSLCEEKSCVSSKDSRYPGTCLPCRVERLATDPIATSITLIITPRSILRQWMEEIDRHTGTRPDGSRLRVLDYRGVKAYTGKDAKALDPEYLAGFDVILTDFDTLGQELNHVRGFNRFIGAGANVLRRKKVNPVIPTPLLALKFWRVVLDEAQQVKGRQIASNGHTCRYFSNSDFFISVS